MSWVFEIFLQPVLSYLGNTLIRPCLPSLPRSFPGSVNSGGDGAKGGGGLQLLEETDYQHQENLHLHGSAGLVSPGVGRRRAGLPAVGSAPGLSQLH